MAKKKKWTAWKAAAMLLTVLFLSGCAKGNVTNAPDNTFYERKENDAEEAGTAYSERMDAVYENAMKQFMEPEGMEEMEGRDIGDKLTRKILSGYQRSYYAFRTLGPVIGIFSIATGILMMMLAKHNKKIKRTGLTVFIIGIPVMVLVIVFGVGIFNGIMIY